jgi:1-acyl-sn-glycerol-3-phosphate acyltransferase
MTYEDAQQLARTRGVSRVIYTAARILLMPLVKVLYRFRITGAEHIPKEGPCIIAPNHKSFYDSFFVGLACPRDLRFMAKYELFEGRSARLLSGLGAFPVRRGTADPEALETARMILRDGGVLALFPEGTRYREPDALKAPHKGAGRLAIEAQAPVVPCAISGSEKLFVGFLPRPVRVQIAFAPAITPEQLEATPQAAAELIEGQVWPEVERQFRDLRSRQGLIAALLAALAAGGGFAVRQQQQKKKRRIPPLPIKGKKKKFRR